MISDVVEMNSPVIFLGTADGVGHQDGSTPLESISVFRMARVKPHFCFPAIMKQSHWCFLVHSESLTESLRIQIINGKDVEVAHVNIVGTTSTPTKDGAHVISSAPGAESAPIPQYTFIVDKGQWVLQSVTIADLLFMEPGEYRLVLQRSEKNTYLGKVIVVFTPPVPLSEEEISAAESDPLSTKSARLTYGCKSCDSKAKVYGAHKRIKESEDEGFQFYEDLSGVFRCSCGKTSIDLSYVRLGMPGFLRGDGRVAAGEISYIKQYAQAKLREVSSKFLQLVQKEKSEEVVQKFIESNKVLLARFHARKLFLKPRILGRFNSDFAVLDTEGALTLIELESPALRLFKANGHLRAGLNHAYEQVQDWLNEVLKHRQAVIEGFGLKSEDVLSFRGCVIAGRSKAEKRDHLMRHMSQPRPGIEFFTFDMLAQSLVRIAEELPSE